jgi:hypothetical protein
MIQPESHKGQKIQLGGLAIGQTFKTEMRWHAPYVAAQFVERLKG